MASRINLIALYGACAVGGFAATMYFNLQFVWIHGGFSPALFIAENYVNYASSSIMNDVWAILITFLIWSYIEAKRLSMRGWWLYALGSLCIALAFIFPLFLLMRERQLCCQRMPSDGQRAALNRPIAG